MPGWRAIGWAALVVAGGCGGGDGVPDGQAGSCDGEPPSLDACFVGDFFADCGGEPSEPVLACHTSGLDCRWFATGCLPDAYVASDCPSDAICCHDDWPFVEPEPELLSRQLYGHGIYPWTRDRAMVVDVVVDPSLPAGEPTFTCTGEDPRGGGSPQTPCTGWLGDPRGRFSRTLDTLTLESPNWGVSGWYPWIEIDLAAPAGLIARACQHPYTDAIAASCPFRPDVACATGGTVTLDRNPTGGELDGLQVALDLQFDGGFGLTGSFALP